MTNIDVTMPTFWSQYCIGKLFQRRSDVNKVFNNTVDQSSLDFILEFVQFLRQQPEEKIIVILKNFKTSHDKYVILCNCLGLRRIALSRAAQISELTR